MYYCNYDGCGKSFTNKHSLKRHEVTHNPDKKFKCDLCSKSFSLPQYLKEHKVVHTGERPFVWKFPGCGKSFRQAGKLSIHRKEHSSSENKILTSDTIYDDYNTCLTNNLNYSGVALNHTMSNYWINIEASLQMSYCVCDLMNQEVFTNSSYPNQYQYSYNLETPLNYFPMCLN